MLCIFSPHLWLEPKESAHFCIKAQGSLPFLVIPIALLSIPKVDAESSGYCGRETICALHVKRFLLYHSLVLFPISSEAEPFPPPLI